VRVNSTEWAIGSIRTLDTRPIDQCESRVAG
jgi:hypothetical protein